MSDSLKRLGARVRQLRTEKKLSQEAFGEQSGISTKYVSDLERGSANVSVHVLERVAATLGVTTIDLLNNEHQAARELLVKEIADFLEKADDEKVRMMYRIMKGVL